MNYIKIIFIYIGLIIGAGFASGREICEYFNFCSNTDYTGIVVASLLFVFVCCAILRKSAKYELYNISDYVKHTLSFSKILQKLFLCLIFADLTVGLVVMLSSCGEIISSIFSSPKLFGSIMLAVCCTVVFIFDIKGIAAINIALVPVIIIIITLICVVSILKKTSSPAFNPAAMFTGANRNMLLLAVCYVSYNTLTAASVLSPASKNIGGDKTILISSFAAGLLIGLLIFIVWLAVSTNFSAVWYESFPLQKLAGMINDNLKNLYSLCLIFSIFTTAVSEGYGILSYFKPKTALSRAVYSVIIFSALLPFSIINFAFLVKNIYFIMGFLGIIWMAVILIDFLKN